MILLANSRALKAFLDAFGTSRRALVALDPSLRALATAVVSHRSTPHSVLPEGRKDIGSPLLLAEIRNRSESEMEACDKHLHHVGTRVRVHGKTKIMPRYVDMSSPSVLARLVYAEFMIWS
jgi:hypothetical protein